MAEPDWAARLQLAFQPVVELAQGATIVGFEVLARLGDGGDGLAEAADPVLACRPGLALVVLQRCAPLLAAWRSGGRPAVRACWLSVNAGPEELLAPEFAAAFAGLTAAQGLSRGAFRLELTEHSALPDLIEAQARLQALAAAGASLAVDDFGAGATSLSWLAALPFECLKLDRSLLLAAEQGARGRAVVRAIASLARELGAACIAEGVENAAQAELLRGCGCGFGQGYFFGRPMSEAALRAWAGG